jgi:ubiquinone/menaquinone biosynthesis C-methylase UbiE
MPDLRVRRAYAGRATEYTAALGSISDTHELDRNRIERWAEETNGPVLDAGCGPGHWTDLLQKQGVDISGIDLVPEFIGSATTRFPEASFRVSCLRTIDTADGSLSGVLAWYSLIHLPSTELSQALSEFARALGSQGRLLVGFFEGESGEPFDHAVTTAYYWSVDQMSSLLHDAGFDVTGVETRQDSGNRPHAAISAIAR